jgi:GTP-binding protein
MTALLLLLLTAASAYAPINRHKGPSRIVPRVLASQDTEQTQSNAPKMLKRVARQARPTVAIIGRPNVGKSTLVNRLCDAGRGGAIAVDEVGVTRDRVYQRAEWCGRVFDVVDTGGLLFDDEESDQFLAEIREQASLALRESCAVVVVVDGRTGIVRTDEDIAAFLRKWPSDIETVLAVNKCESPEREPEMVADFWPLGLGEPLPCSAIHGYGVAEVLDAVLPAVDNAIELRRQQIEQLDAQEAIPRINVALLGRPNVGKSSLMNRFLGPGEQRSIVSDVAGTTRDAVDAELDVDGSIFRFVDTAGVRRKARVKDGTETQMVGRALKAAKLADVVLLVVDATAEITDQDAMLAQRIADDGRACVVLANKWDIYEGKDEGSTREVLKVLRETLTAVSWAEVVFCSAETGQRCLKVYDAVKRARESHHHRVSTATLNEVVRDAMLWQPPPATAAGKNAGKVYFVSQTAVAPPTFVCMCNDPKAFPKNYRRFLERKLRESMPFTGTPVRFVFRARRQREAERDGRKRSR